MRRIGFVMLACVLQSACSPSPDSVKAASALPPTKAPVPMEVRAVSQADRQPLVVVAESSSKLADYQLIRGQGIRGEHIRGLAGNLSSSGSDTLANLVTLWTESFKREYPSVNIQVQGAGSSTAPPALTEGTANFGPMSRPMTENEIQAFEGRHGYKPTPVRVAMDALAVYVHKDNPLESLRIDQVDAIYSITRRCGGSRDWRVWGEAGLPGSWKTRPIQLYGRNSVSGTYGYFKQVALCSGDFKNTVNEQPGSASVVQAIASSLNGVGYSGIGYVTQGVKALALSAKGNQPVAATTANALSGDYPLARYLYVYVNKRPNTPLTLLETEFLRLVLSAEGQEIVKKDGYIPLSAEVAQMELAKLE